jgi:hypothetical protein
VATLPGSGCVGIGAVTAHSRDDDQRFQAMVITVSR